MKYSKYLILLTLIYWLNACSFGSMQDYFQPGVYQVEKGDTLYSIAWRYQLPHRDLIAWNKIPSPFIIFPGQRIALSPEAASRMANGGEDGSSSLLTLPSSNNHQNDRMASSRRQSEGQASVNSGNTRSSTGAATLRLPPAAPSGTWLWPTQGKVIQHFIAGDKGRQGADIDGRLGQDIIASSRGEVVYSGSGLASYGLLVIIKHDDIYLSAYANNNKLLVKEGDKVKAGQKIAEMGKNRDKQVMLHFEIRKQGKPVNPLWYLRRR